MDELKSIIGKVATGATLTREEAASAFDSMMSGEATPSQMGGLLMALRVRGETVEEITGAVSAMRGKMLPVKAPAEAVDIVGTGGDGAHTVNISTMSAIVAAGAGATVVKHGNRAASSKSGAADVLEALGVRLDLSPQRVAEVATSAGITFCFAQTFHPSFRHTAPTRSELGIRTAFNVLGPLTNPAAPRYASVGAADARVAPLMADVFAERGKSAAVSRGDDGLDEVTVTTTSTVHWVSEGTVSAHTVDPVAHGIAIAPLTALRGGDAGHNAAVVHDLLAGREGAVRDAVLLNAGLALAVVDAGEQPGRFGRHGDLDTALAAGMAKARESIDSGAAAAALDRWAAATAESR